MIPNIKKVKGMFYITEKQVRSKKPTRKAVRKYKKPDNFNKLVTKLPSWNEKLKEWGIKIGKD